MTLTVALLALVAGVVYWASDDDEKRTAPSSSTSSLPPTTEAPGTTVAPGDLSSTVMWPAPGTASSFTTSADAARSFAVEFLRMTAPLIGEFRQGDSRSGEVAVRPTARGPETTVLVRQVGPGANWSVLGATTAQIEVAEPSAGQVLTSPVRVAGRALAFEGTVNVEVRVDGGGAVGEGFVTGGGDETRPFEGSIPFETPGSRYGAVVFFELSAEDGSVWRASTVRVEFASTGIAVASCGGYRSPRPVLTADQMELTVYFTCDAGETGNPLRPVYRAVPKTQAVLEASLRALLAGATPEEKTAELDSWFSDATRDALRSVTVNGGHAVVDFADLSTSIPNASSSAGSERLLSQLDATVFQFATVTSVEYRLLGSCSDFNEWLQYGGCEPRTRGVSED